MKTASKLVAVLLVISFPSIAHAQTPGEPPATPTPQASPGSPMMGSSMQDIQATMKKMQEQMATIRSTSDPAERQKLMFEHMSTMREAMGTMMKTGSAMGMMPGGGMMRGDGKKSSTTPGPRDMRGRMGMMEQRMGMMQIMMEQMMQHQEMMERRP
jgi:hypothetical protein